MLSIATVKTETRDWHVLIKVSLKNGGASVVGPGTMLGRYTSTGGAVRFVEFRNSKNISPGCTAEVSQLLSAMSELHFTGYRQSNGVIIPFSGGMVKRLSFLRSVAVGTSRWWDEVLVQSTSIAARLRALLATAWMRLEIDRRVNHGAEIAVNAWRSINAELVRWRDEVLLPRLGSIASRLKAFQENARLRLADAKQKSTHRAPLERQAWKAVDAEIRRWWVEVVARSKSIAVRLRALLATAWMRLEIARRANQGAEIAARAWRSLNAALIRWRDEFLLPRIGSTTARFKAFQQNAWLRLADAKQKRKQSAPSERQAWESADAEIMRWWAEVVARSKSIVARLRAPRATAEMRLEIDRSVSQGADGAARAWRSINAALVRWRNEVLLPRLGSIVARFKALPEDAWVRLADAKQERKHRAQVERQAWESVDARIMRWWDEVLAAAAKIYRRPN